MGAGKGRKVVPKTWWTRAGVWAESPAELSGTHAVSDEIPPHVNLSRVHHIDLQISRIRTLCLNLTLNGDVSLIFTQHPGLARRIVNKYQGRNPIDRWPLMHGQHLMTFDGNCFCVVAMLGIKAPPLAVLCLSQVVSPPIHFT